VPVEVRNDATGLGTSASAGALTVLVWPSATATSFPLHVEGGASGTIAQQGTSVTLAGISTPVILRVHAAASAVTRDGVAVTQAASIDAVLGANGDAWFADGAGFVWIRVASASAATTIVTS
jgi:hypothetical protein